METQYFLYVRKSSEGEEKQVQSLDDQTQVMKARAKQLGISIVKIFSESKSAKAPGRLEFNKMIGELYEGKAKGVIAWKLDRLSRNPIDTGTIQYMLQNGTLDKIVTSDREYHPIDAGLLMSVETGMANQYILDLRKNVLRGMKCKTEKGVFCGQVPEGYLNNRLEKTIEVDERNFPIIKKAWDLMLTGTYTIPKIVDFLNTTCHYKSNKKGRNKITVGGAYGMFKNVFYTGNFMWKGEIKPGTHTAMISMQEFEKVQHTLGEKWSKVRPKTLEFTYSGIMRCGECGCAVVGTQKTKTIKTTGEEKTYTYYHCSKRKKSAHCSQKRIRLEDLETQFHTILSQIDIIPEFKELALDILRDNFEEEKESFEKVRESLYLSIETHEKKLSRLLDLLIDEKIDAESYEVRKQETQRELMILKEKLSETDTSKGSMYDKIEEVFHFVIGVHNRFKDANIQSKKIILSHLGENFVLFNERVALDIHGWFHPIEKLMPRIKGEYDALEPNKKGISLGKTNASCELISLWSEGPGLNWHTQGLKP